MKTLVLKHTKHSVFLIKDDSEYSFDDYHKRLYMTNLSADGQGNWAEVNFTSDEVELISGVIPPNDWFPDKYKIINGEWIKV